MISFAITPELIASATTYDQYISHAAARFTTGLSTTDDEHYNTPEILGYTKLNLHRMSRLDRLTVIEPALKGAMAAVPEPWTWLVLTESWCGDAAQIVPVLHKLAEESPNITFRLLLRDQNPVLMNDYLTNGGRAIPKLICLRKDPSAQTGYAELGTWGPRPAGLQVLMNTWRTENITLSESVERAQRWYNDDHAESIKIELLALVASWSKISV